MIKTFADWFVYEVLRIKQGSLAGEALDFFVYDSIKIFLLLTCIIYVVSILRTWLPPEKTRVFLSQKKSFTGNILASLIGVITPFCTCSAIPLFLGFIEAGVPLGVTFSFLVASPMVNEVAIILLIGMFGVKTAVIYVISGLLIAIVSGIVIGKMNVENLLEDFVRKNKGLKTLILPEMSFRDRLNYAKEYTIDILKKVMPYVLIGIGIGAFIHGYVPTEVLSKYVGGFKWYTVPLAILIGVPLYSNAAGVIPLVSVLTEKGVTIGTSLAFMMAVTGLSLPEFIILKKVMKTRLILIFAGIVSTGILLIGYLFNYLDYHKLLVK
ncbi:MAG: permease [Firmicutes bacterium]|nr:permease [Bacillota bacterium]